MAQAGQKQRPAGKVPLMPRARGLLPCLWPYGLEPSEGALGPGWVRWKQFTLRAIGSLVPVFRHSIGTSQRWWNRAGWAHHRGGPTWLGRQGALMRYCGTARGCEAAVDCLCARTLRSMSA